MINVRCGRCSACAGNPHKNIPQVQGPESFQIAINLMVADKIGVHLELEQLGVAGDLATAGA
jgi:hypothetical protein